MAFPPSFLDELRARIGLSHLIGRRVRLAKRGRNHLGLCPFHNEKTPSFTVNDDKGFFHCFGCGAHGDAIGFVMRTEGLTFPEAVERLAQEAGLPLPSVSPEERAQAQRLGGLANLLEAAASWYQAQLTTSAGRAALQYIKGRGLSDDTIARFRLGYAPANRTGLRSAMAALGYGVPHMIEAGLLSVPEDGGEAFDRMRDRVMFPITDRRGRVIAFGGRAMQADALAKYMNSPETPLFHKGRTLYNHAIARQAAQDAGHVIVAEGYMDVIALAQAGFAQAVAPLGTALTEDQMALLWRMAAEPILCFDGDKAGLGAAMRAVDRALPLLEPGQSLRFAIMPQGLDPDDLIKAQGAEAMRAVLESAQPMAEMLWRKETDGQPTHTPEARAAMEKKLMDQVARIRHPAVRAHYQQAMRERLRQFFAPAPRASGADRNRRSVRGARPFDPGPPPPPSPGGQRRERLLILGLVRHPWLLERHEEAFASLPLSHPDLDAMRQALLESLGLDAPLDPEGVRTYLIERGFAANLEKITGQTDLEKFTRPDSLPQEVEEGWLHVLDRHRRAQTLGQELSMASQRLSSEPTEANYARYEALRRQLADEERQDRDVKN